MITCASFLGENARPVYAALVGYMADAAGVPARLLPPTEWAQQNRLLDDGSIQVAFICGLPYSERHDRPGQPLVLLAAPVMQAARYGGRPVYYSDVVVRAGSPYTAFADLRGRAWAYNGVDSNSGYNMPRDYLLARGETDGFFGRVVETGSHQRSLEMVLSGAVDASAIDSLVLEMEVNLRPALAAQFRIIESIGPCPVPPVAASAGLAEETRRKLRRALLAMHECESGRAVLRGGLIDRFVEVDDAYYNPIREMTRRAQQAGYVELR